MPAGSALRDVETRLLVAAKIGCLAQQNIVQRQAHRNPRNPLTVRDTEWISLPEAFREVSGTDEK